MITFASTPQSINPEYLNTLLKSWKEDDAEYADHPLAEDVLAACEEAYHRAQRNNTLTLHADKYDAEHCSTPVRPAQWEYPSNDSKEAYDHFSVDGSITSQLAA